MSTLQVVATVPVRPESAATAATGLATLAQKTRDEEGCISYVLYESLATPGTFVTVEQWRSQDDLDAHLASDHVAQAFAEFGEHLAGEVAVHPLHLV